MDLSPDTGMVNWADRQGLLPGADAQLQFALDLGVRRR
jgi:hypothetical protein